MHLIPRKVGVNSEPSKNRKRKCGATSLDRIFNAIESNKCLAFLGAGASTGYPQAEGYVEGLPSGTVLAEKLAKKCDYVNGRALGLAEVAEYFWKMMIPQRTLLFLGYSLADWNFQVIWEGVLAALKDQDRNVRSRAASALGSLFKIESVANLLKMLAHHQSGYRTAAVEAIAAQDTISAELQQEVKQRRDEATEPWTRMAAWEAYERIQQRRKEDRADSLARAQADSLFKAQDYSAAEKAFLNGFERLFKNEGIFEEDTEALNRVSPNDSLTRRNTNSRRRAASLCKSAC